MAATLDAGLRSKPAFIAAFANQYVFPATNAAGREAGFLTVTKLPAQHWNRQSFGVLGDKPFDGVEVGNFYRLAFLCLICLHLLSSLVVCAGWHRTKNRCGELLFHMHKHSADYRDETLAVRALGNNLAD